MPFGCTLRPNRLWLLWIALGCGCFLPLLVALGQATTLPSNQRQPHVRFGTVKVVDAEMGQPALQSSQPPAKDSKKKKPDSGDKGAGVLLYAMPVTPPIPDQLFRLDSEDVFRERLRTEVRQRSSKIQLEFPESDQAVPMRPPARDWPAYVKWVEPNYVISKRLFFEQPRFERYGESLGILQPAVSTGIFCLDLLLWPARRAAHPFRCYQVNTDCYSPYFQIVGK